MRFLSKLALVVLLALGIEAAGHAQGLVNPLLPVKGTKEVAFRGNITFEPDDDYDVSGRYGVFVDDGRLEVGGSLRLFKTVNVNFNPTFTGLDQLSRQTPGEPTFSDDTAYEIGAFVNYHFPGASALLPYIGAFIGFSDSGGDNSTSYGVEGGVKYFINSSVAFTAALVYRDHDDRDVDNDIFIDFGLSIFLR